MKIGKLLLITLLGVFLILGCEEDTENDNNEDDVAAWVGTWLSAGDNVASLLSTYFAVDSIYVEFTAEGIVELNTHYAGTGWIANSGTYTVTESEDGDIDVFWAEYTIQAFEQEGIIQITEGNSDVMQLEVVQTVPDISATVPTPADGFGGTALGNINIQTYVRVED